MSSVLAEPAPVSGGRFSHFGGRIELHVACLCAHKDFVGETTGVSLHFLSPPCVLLLLQIVQIVQLCLLELFFNLVEVSKCDLSEQKRHIFIPSGHFLFWGWRE